MNDAEALREIDRLIDEYIGGNISQIRALSRICAVIEKAKVTP